MLGKGRDTVQLLVLLLVTAALCEWLAIVRYRGGFLDSTKPSPSSLSPPPQPRYHFVVSGYPPTIHTFAVPPLTTLPVTPSSHQEALSMASPPLSASLLVTSPIFFEAPTLPSGGYAPPTQVATSPAPPSQPEQATASPEQLLPSSHSALLTQAAVPSAVPPTPISSASPLANPSAPTTALTTPPPSRPVSSGNVVSVGAPLPPIRPNQVASPSGSPQPSRITTPPNHVATPQPARPSQVAAAGKPPPAPSRAIPPTPAVVDKRQELLEIYQATLGAFQATNVTFWIDFGTLLAIVRDGNIIAGDSDADLSVTNIEAARISDPKHPVHQDLNARGFALVRSGNNLLKVFRKTCPCLDRDGLNAPMSCNERGTCLNVDLFVFGEGRRCMIRRCFFNWRHSCGEFITYNSFPKALLYDSAGRLGSMFVPAWGLHVPIPFNVTGLLEYRYTPSWRIPRPSDKGPRRGCDDGEPAPHAQKAAAAPVPPHIPRVPI